MDVEQAYLDAANAFLQEAQIRSLRVIGLENQAASKAAPANGSDLSTEAVLGVLRCLLREEFWCKLESPSAFIHFGYDYYMYIGVPKRCEAAEKFSRRVGLFPE